MGCAYKARLPSGVRLQSMSTIGGALTKHAYYRGCAYKARLQWGTPAGECGDGALTKHACSGVCQQVSAGMARLQSTPEVFREYGARLQSTPEVFREYGARLQSTPAVGGVCR